MQTTERRKINGEWIKALRKDLNLSQEELAEQLGVSRSAVARWEADAFRPTKLAAKVLLEFADKAREAQGAAAPAVGSPVVDQDVPHESHSPRRGTDHEPEPNGKHARKP